MGRVDLHYCSSSSLFWTALLFKRETEIYSSPFDLTGCKDFVAFRIGGGGMPERRTLYVELLLFAADFSVFIPHCGFDWSSSALLFSLLSA